MTAAWKVLAAALAASVSLACPACSQDARPLTSLGFDERPRDAAVDAPASMKLTQVVAEGPWGLGGRGLAVDQNGNLFVAAVEAVYVSSGAEASVYLSRDDISAILGPEYPLPDWDDLDVGPDGLVYLLSSQHIIRSANAHQGEVLRKFLPIVFPRHLAVFSPDISFVLTANRELFRIDATGYALVYDISQMHGVNACVGEELEIQRSGTFLYLPGCDGSPVVRGHVDGSGTIALFDGHPNALNARFFLCAARDPAGGFFIMIEDDTTNDPKLMHFDEGVSAMAGYRTITTSPSLADAVIEHELVFDFSDCQMAAAHDGSVWIRTEKQLLRLTP